MIGKCCCHQLGRGADRKHQRGAVGNQACHQCSDFSLCLGAGKAARIIGKVDPGTDAFDATMTAPQLIGAAQRIHIAANGLRCYAEVFCKAFNGH